MIKLYIFLVAILFKNNVNYNIQITKDSCFVILLMYNTKKWYKVVYILRRASKFYAFMIFYEKTIRIEYSQFLLHYQFIFIKEMIR